MGRRGRSTKAQKAGIPTCPAALYRGPGRNRTLDGARSKAGLPTQCSPEEAATRLHTHTSFPHCGPGMKPQAHMTVLCQKQKISVLINKKICGLGRSAIGERGLAGGQQPEGNTVCFTLFSPVEMAVLSIKPPESIGPAKC